MFPYRQPSIAPQAAINIFFRRRPFSSSHLAALGDDDIHIWDVAAAPPSPRSLHLLHDLHAVDDLPEDDVLPV